MKKIVCEVCGEEPVFEDGLCIKCFKRLKEEELSELEFMLYG